MPDIGIVSLQGNLRQSGVVERESFQIVATTPTGATQAVTFARTDSFFVAGVLTGFADGTGVVTVKGLDENSSSAEISITFTGNQRRLDFNQEWTSITEINTSGLDNESTVGTVTLEAVDQAGQPQEQLATVKTIKCALTRAREGQVIESSGGAPIEAARVFMFPDEGLRRSDIITVDGNRWEIKAIQHRYDHLRMHAFDVAIVFAEDQA